MSSPKAPETCTKFPGWWFGFFFPYIFSEGLKHVEITNQYNFPHLFSKKLGIIPWDHPSSSQDAPSPDGDGASEGASSPEPTVRLDVEVLRGDGLSGELWIMVRSFEYEYWYQYSYETDSGIWYMLMMMLMMIVMMMMMMTTTTTTTTMIMVQPSGKLT